MNRVIFLRLLAKLILFAEEHGINIFVYEYYRDADRQRDLYKMGKSKCDGFVRKSPHQKGLAVDIAILKDGDADWESPHYETLGEYWQSIGGIWGGGWKSLVDKCHYEYKP